MEDNFRNALIIISTIIIAAIFIHGLWTIRKNKNPYKLKAKPEQVGEFERSFDGTGFDQDGVSQPKVVGKNHRHSSSDCLSAQEIPDSPAPAPDYSEEPLPKDLDEPCLGEIEQIDEFNLPPVSTPMSTDQQTERMVTTQPIEREQSPINEPQKVVAKPVYQDPVIQAKPKSNVVSVKSTQELKRNQMEINFAAEQELNEKNAHRHKPQVNASAELAHNSTIEPEFLVVSVLAPEHQMISGAALLPSLLTLGMRYGEMNIFHRHQDNAGNGEITFSLANMLNPGTFDLNQMETFVTKGISLFMSLPNAGKATDVFEQMISAARQLAQEFDGQILDDKRNVFTQQTEQHYQSKIREFERKSRVVAH
jgi:cell division protein ZipA